MTADIHIPGYEILDELGAGGMAKVYLGIQTSLDRKVAIKILHAALSMQSDEFKQRFFHEGKVLARVNHPNIVSIFDIGEVEGLLYMAMEYVPGGTLTDKLKEGPLSVDEVVRVVGQVGLALHTTHLEHIVHRDLKPSNVLMKNGVTPMLTDFGIARETDTDTSLTQTGHIVGTLQYMSPEQIRGLTVDHRSDIYALGLLFYRLLTGQLPFMASSHYDLSRMQCEDPPPPLPPPLSEFQPIMDVILAKDPNERFQTALEFCKALQNIEVGDEDYRTELTQATQIYDPNRMPFQSYTGSGPHSGSHSGTHGGDLSGPRAGQDSGRFSGQHSQRTSGQWQADSGRYETQPPQPGMSGKLKSMLLIGLPVVALALAVVLYFAIWHVPSTGLSDADQRRLDNYLRRVEGYYNSMNIDEPPQENAVYFLRRSLEMAPEYEPALEWARLIAEFYEVDARMALEEGDFERAREEIQKGLDVDPEYELLAELKNDLDSAVAERERLAAIDSELSVAQSYQAQGLLLEPPGGNAFEAFKRVLELDPVNQQALQGLAQIEGSLVDEVQSVIASNDLARAGTMLDRLEERFPNSSEVMRLRNSVGEQLRLAQENEQVLQLLSQARQQVADGKLIEPQFDNALESYTQVLNLRPDNGDALQGMTVIAGLYQRDAQAALQQGDFQSAVELADNGLLAVPDDGELSSIRQQALGQLGAREREIQDLLKTAQNLVMSGDFLPPGDNALDTFRRVEEMDPGNAQAQRGLNLLPTNISDEIEQMKMRGFLDEAQALAGRAAEAYPQRGEFADLGSELAGLIAAQAEQERLADMLSNASTLIATRPMTLDVIEQSANALERIRTEFPGQTQVGSQLSSLISAIIAEADRVGKDGQEASGILLLERGLDFFSGNAELTQARRRLVQARDERIAAEQARIAAMTGQLAIDALPWAEVLEITDQAGTVQPLPDDRTTPLLVSLLEGGYTVTLRNQDTQEPRQVNVTVVAQQVATATARFETISADAYFEQSGW